MLEYYEIPPGDDGEAGWPASLHTDFDVTWALFLASLQGRVQRRELPEGVHDLRPPDNPSRYLPTGPFRYFRVVVGSGGAAVTQYGRYGDEIDREVEFSPPLTAVYGNNAAGRERLYGVIMDRPEPVVARAELQPAGATAPNHI